METVNPPFEGYTCQELLAIYHRAGSVELDRLYQAADELYPNRRQERPGAAILVEEGLHGRMFRRVIDGEEVCEAPRYTIKSQPLNWIGILEDGTALEY
jgi:hypothetical protein